MQMDRKILNTFMLLAIFIAIVIGGSIYSFVHQKGIIDDKENELKELNINAVDTEDLIAQLNELKKRAAKLDSILALRKFNIPVSLPQSRFFDFVNKVSFSFSPLSFVNIEYSELNVEEHFKYYVYRLTGTANFNDLYKLIYAIEQSKELKKVLSSDFSNFVKVDEESIAHYLVNYTLQAAVYFSDNDRFASSKLKENKLRPNPLYDVFYPLIRNEIPPNIDNQLDVQTAQLLALIPDGAFLSDAKGDTYLLWEGDAVYLGYLTEKNYINIRN
jgi:hypothetical protein